MDDDLEQIEAELRRRSPLPLSSSLVKRIDSELNSPTQHQRWWAWSLPVAAAITLVMTWNAQRPNVAPPSATPQTVVQTAPPNNLKPVAIKQVLYATRDEGVVTLSDGSRARQQRLQYVDSVTWKNPQTNVSVTWTLPREEVRVVRVVYQ